MRSNGKFPDYIDVGTDVWQQVYDWHVRFQQATSAWRGRRTDATRIVLLATDGCSCDPDLAPGFIGMPYDNR